MCKLNRLCGRVQRALLPILLAALPAVGWGDETAAPYAERLVRSGQSWDDAGGVSGIALAGPVATPANAGEGAQAAYLKQLEALQRAGGPYAAGLAEPLESLALLQLQSGDLAGAASLYSRALHILRVNEGLRSARQLSLLRQLIDLARRGNDLELLDDRYDYLYFLQGGSQAPENEAALAVQLEYLRWQREALRLGIRSGQGRSRLLDALDLNEQLLEDSAPDAPVALSPGSRWPLVQSQLRNLYLLQDMLPPVLDEPGLRGMRSYTPLAGNELDTQRQRLEQQRRSGLHQGRNLLQDAIDSLPADAPERRAARLALADWHQWHGQSRRAQELYGALARQLIAMGDEETWADWFAEPVELPDNGAFWQPLAAGEQVEGPVTLDFRVTENGRVRDLETIALPAEAEGIEVRLRRELAGVRFRPRVSRSGTAEESLLQRQYEWLPLRRSRWP